MKHKKLSELPDGTYVVLDVNEDDLVFTLPLVPKIGYWVGVKPITLDEIREAYYDYTPVVVGIWTADDKTVHVDRSVWFEYEWAARRHCRIYDQQSFYDCENEAVIYL